MNRQGIDRVKDEPKPSLAAKVHALHTTLRELVQLGIFLLLSGISIGVLLVGAFRVRFWLG